MLRSKYEAFTKHVVLYTGAGRIKIVMIAARGSLNRQSIGSSSPESQSKQMGRSLM
jgi:hypothetical protein